MAEPGGNRTVKSAVGKDFELKSELKFDLQSSCQSEITFVVGSRTCEKFSLGTSQERVKFERCAVVTIRRPLDKTEQILIYRFYGFVSSFKKTVTSDLLVA